MLYKNISIPSDKVIYFFNLKIFNISTLHTSNAAAWIILVSDTISDKPYGFLNI